MILIGGDTDPESGGTIPAQQEDLKNNYAVPATYVSTDMMPGTVGKPIPWNDFYVEPANARGYYITPIDLPPPTTATIDFTNKTITFLTAGDHTIPMQLENAAGDVIEFPAFFDIRQ